MLTASASALAPLDSSVQQASVVNLFKISKEWENSKESEAEVDLLLSKDNLDVTAATTEFVEAPSSWCDKDLQLWDRDKAAVVESLMSRLRSTVEVRHRKSKEKDKVDTSPNHATDSTRDVPDVVMSHELEVLLSWIDRHSTGLTHKPEEAMRIFADNIRPLLSSCEANAHNFIDFLLDLFHLGDSKKSWFLRHYLHISLKHLQSHAWGSLHLTFLNTKGIFLDSLMAVGNKTPIEILNLCVECANLAFPGQSTGINAESKHRHSEYYFFIAYLLFRAGCVEGIRILIRKGEVHQLPSALEEEHYPPLYNELCMILLNILLMEKEDVNREVLLGRFTSEYFPTKQTSITFLGKGSNFYVLLLLSIVYPDYYAPCDSEALPTKEDYLWYQISLLLAGPSNSLSMAAANLCHTLTQEIKTIKANDGKVVERVFSYAYSIALAGGVMESLRLLMSAIQKSCVQAFALVFLVTLGNFGLFESDDIKYIASTLWNLEQNAFKKDEVAYLMDLAFSRKRNVSPELKILLATLLPQKKAGSIMKYVIAENFNEAVNICFIGTAATRNGMLVIGPLLQKLIKLATRRGAAKLAILRMAQYSANVGLWSAAFKCFYCIQDVDNCVSVLEACCCYLYDSTENSSNSSLNSTDLCVYFSLLKSLAPNHKRLSDLTHIFDCIKISVLVDNNEHKEAVLHAKRNRVFDGVAHILRNESHMIYFHALVDFIKALKHMVSSGQQPHSLLTEMEAHNLVDLLESAYQNPNSDKNRAVEAIHMLMGFITIVPPKPGQ